MTHRTRLELTWPGKDDPRPRLEPRILLEDAERSYHAPHRVSDADLFDSRVIFGDNLLALKALEQEFTGKIQCIYIDPPFNTGDAFEHYDDGIEHSLWLSLMRDRLQLLSTLLSPSGTIYVHIDNNEFAYLKVIMDEVLGRQNFVQMISVKRASPAGFKVINPGPLTVTDYILLYAKEKSLMKYKPVRIAVPYDSNYNLYISNPEDSPGDWKLEKLVDLLYEKNRLNSWREARQKWGSQWQIVRQSLLGDMALEMSEQVVSVRDPHKPSQKIRDAMAISRLNPGRVYPLERSDNKPTYVYNGGALSFYSDKLRVVDGIRVPTELLTDFWHDVNFAGMADEGSVQFKNGKKPEMLVRRVLQLGSDPGDWVLDSFAGSGTTGAVAHKMGRRFIMVELGEHCHTHILPRLQKVVDGTDQGGISKAVEWKGGGGFRYYRLAPSLLQTDDQGYHIINPGYNAEMLAEAVCKLEGFRYEPDEAVYWAQGRSTERDFLYVTTQTLTYEQLAHLSEEVGPERTLLVCCSAWHGRAEAFANLTLKKIPNAVRERCEWGRDDYSLAIAALPPPEPEGAPGDAPPERPAGRGRGRKPAAEQEAMEL